MQTPVLKVLEEYGWGLERLALLVHSKLRWVLVLQMWAFVPHIVVSGKLVPGPSVVVQVMHKKLWLWNGTSFLHSSEFGFGRKH